MITITTISTQARWLLGVQTPWSVSHDDELGHLAVIFEWRVAMRLAIRRVRRWNVDTRFSFCHQPVQPYYWGCRAKKKTGTWNELKYSAKTGGNENKRLHPEQHCGHSHPGHPGKGSARNTSKWAQHRTFRVERPRPLRTCLSPIEAHLRYNSSYTEIQHTQRLAKIQVRRIQGINNSLDKQLNTA